MTRVLSFDLLHLVLCWMRGTTYLTGAEFIMLRGAYGCVRKGSGAGTVGPGNATKVVGH